MGTPIQFTSVPKVSAARMPWMCPSVRPGITVRPPRSISFAVSPASFFIAAEAPVARILPSAIATACCDGEILVDGEDLAVEEDRVGGLGDAAMPAGDVTMKAAAK